MRTSPRVGPRFPRALAATALLVACGKPAPMPSHSSTPAAPPAATRPVTLTPSDVTMIWPMPADEAQRDSMLAATSRGGYGELLPATHYPVPVLDERDWKVKDPLVDRARLRVVTARLDPCFASFAPPSDPSCVNQVRLVLQVLRPGGGQGGATPSPAMGANDGAVHAFYKVSREELLSLARELAALRDRHGEAGPAETLGVHPVLAREGLGSAYAKDLQALLAKQIGVDRLIRVTFFARTAAKEPLWPFGLFDLVDGKLVQQMIVTLEVNQQTLEGAGPRKVIDPATSSPDNPGALVSLFGAPREASPAERTAYASLLRIQNPIKHTPDTMACAECHASQRMQAAAEKTLGLRPGDFADDHFESSVKPTPDSKIDAENFHAAGYLGTNLAVSTRTANETAVVVAALNALLGG